MNFELAVKRSKFDGKISDFDLVRLVRRTLHSETQTFGGMMAPHALGYVSEVRVIHRISTSAVRFNFDAENMENRTDITRSKLKESDYEWSETVQTSAGDALRQTRRAAELCIANSKFSVNFVIGNKKYHGCSENASTLGKMLREFDAHLAEREREYSSRFDFSERSVKVGAEGIRNGTDAAELCAEYGATLYILQNNNTQKLVELAGKHDVETAMYSIVRFGYGGFLTSAKKNALKDLLRILGPEYFNRRGLKNGEIQQKAHLYSMFGNAGDIAGQVEFWQSLGVENFVFNLVFDSMVDFGEQVLQFRRMMFDYLDLCEEW